MKVYIKNQPGEKDINTVAIYMPSFRMGITEALLKLVTILNQSSRDRICPQGPRSTG